MEQVAAWVAPATTMIAACMTAANLGARITGWGFVVFTVGSLGWVTVALATHQPNLLWTNLLLTLVNVAGIWRWLFRRARFADAASATVERSARASTPTLFPASRLDDCPVRDRNGEEAGHAVDAMVGCGDGRVRYVVVREGGAAGVGERLHAVDWRDVEIDDDGVTLTITRERLEASPPIDDGQWPIRPTT